MQVFASWLLELKRMMYDITTEAAQEFWPAREGNTAPFFNYRLEHVRQVERDALRLWYTEGGDRDIILAAVWIHDMFMPQFEGAQHAIRGAKWAMAELANLGFPEQKVETVAQAVALHDRKLMDIPYSLPEARILWDAEHLARIGPAGMLNYTFCHTSDEFIGSLPDFSDYPENTITLQDFAQGLADTRPPLYRADLFYYEASRQLARRRINVIREYIDTLEAQLWLREVEVPKG